ncbi:MAG: hypothetical protein WCP92_00730 [bacterium]
MTNKDQYPLFITSLLSSTNYTGLGLFEKPTHLKNTLSMIDTKNKTPIYTEVIKELEKADNTYTVEVKKDSKSIIITSSDKKKITLSQKTENAVTTLDAKITTV